MRAIVFALCYLLNLTGTAKADPVLRLMNGAWRGDGHYLLLDAERMLANDNPEKPFRRDPLVIRNITGRMVVFQINRNRFIGLFEGENLRLTGDGIRGSASLRRAVRP